MFLTGWVGWKDVAQLLAETGSVLAFLAGMLVVGFVADQAGVFSWLAYHAARLSKGSGRRLYVGLYAIGVLVTIWFSLDTTAVILAPLVYNLVRALNVSPLPFIFATVYVANTASLLLPVSNLTNLIIWNKFDIPFWHYAKVMALPALVAIVLNLLLFLWYFRRDIPARFSTADLAARPEAAGEPLNGFIAPMPTKRLVRCQYILAGILIGLSTAPFFDWEIWIVACVGALILAGLEITNRDLRPKQLLSGISWDLLPFVFSLFLVMRGVGNSGLSDVAQNILAQTGAAGSFAQLLIIAATAALGSNLINNLPMLLIAADSLTAPVTSGQLGMDALYAALIGTNLGPNLTVIGSLATMLSLSIVGKKGLRIPGLLYLKIGLVTVPILLLGSVVALWLV